jgi:hypothetical protein
MPWQLQSGQNVPSENMKSNFVNNHIRLNGNVHGHKLKLCNKCEEVKPPEGGVQMSAARWICASCWTDRETGRNLKQVRESR